MTREITRRRILRLTSIALKTALLLMVFAMSGGCPYQKYEPLSASETPSLKPKVPAPGVYHTVALNETLWKIADAYNVNLQLLAEVNNLKPPYILRENTGLFIPNATNVKRVETISRDVPDDTRVEEYTGLLSWPVQGEVISHYGVRSGEQHNGISIQAREGTPVRSAGDGKVGHVGTIPGFGNVVLIEHANRIVTVYAHLKETRAKSDIPVKRGQVIGTVGSTGRVESPSLYFEVRSRSKPRNPLFFLSRRRPGARGLANHEAPRANR